MGIIMIIVIVTSFVITAIMLLLLLLLSLLFLLVIISLGLTVWGLRHPARARLHPICDHPLGQTVAHPEPREDLHCQLCRRYAVLRQGVLAVSMSQASSQQHAGFSYALIMVYSGLRQP